MGRLLIATAVAALAAIAAASYTLPIQAANSGLSSGPMIESLTEQGQGLSIVQKSSDSGVAAFAVANGPGILLPVGESDPAEQRASVFVDLYGQAFGLRGRGDVRLTRQPRRDDLGLEHVKFQQVHLGVPVAGGELIVHLRGQHATGANGRVLDHLPDDVRPTVAPETAVGAARQVIARYQPKQAADAHYGTPQLEIVSRAFLDHQPGGQARLAWFVEATGPDLRQFIWIDARTGGLLVQFSQLATAMNRQVYNANNGLPPGTLARAEGDGPTGTTEVDAAYDLSGAAYNFFFNMFGRDSYDGLGSPLISVVNADSGAVNLNDFLCAQWTGSQLVFCDNSILTDDLVGHEWTHAVTDREAKLYFTVQSGALNESFSDIFGETIDLMTPNFNDQPFYRWQIGEDSPFGAIRNLMFGFPGKVSDFSFNCDTLQDGGGVHTNSSVPSHAYALMVDGGSYNSYTITGIGLDKAARIEYRALTTYLTSSSGFLDDFSALNQSCVDLVGTAGITTADCSEVEKALRAVEMNAPWNCTDGAMKDVPSLCPAGGSPSYLFNNDFEAPITQWTTSSTTATQWTSQSFNVDEGVQAMLGSNPVGNHDHRIAMNANIGGAPLPAGTRAIFRHLAEFDGGFDGAAVEYSTNGGTSWLNANPLIDGGLRPDVTIADTTSPFLGRTIFSKPSYGYRTSRLTLASLAGQNVRLRFRVASGVGVGPDFPTSGWFLDRVAVYTCPVAAGAPTITGQPQPQLVATGGAAVFSVGATSNPASTLRYQWLKDGVPIVSGTSLTPSLAVISQLSSQGYYSVIVSNDVGSVTSDAAPLTVNIIGFTGPRFITQPISRTITEGQNVEFSADFISVSGGPTFQWQFSTAGSNGPWTNVPNSPPYSLNGVALDISNVPLTLNGTWYRLSATDSDGITRSNPVVLNVLPANIMTNGTFATGDTSSWTYFDSPTGTGEHHVTGGVFEWNRPGDSNSQSLLFQVSNRAVSGTPLAAQFDLGNSANIRQRVSVLMLDSDFSDLSVCTFWLEAGAPMRTYRMRTHTTKSWTNAAIYFYAATTASFAANGGYLRLDNVSMSFNDTGSDLRTECQDPTAPAPGAGPDSATLLTNGDFSAGIAGWTTFGVITSQVANGVFEYMRPSPGPATPAGVVFQATGAAVNAGQALTATLDLGNSSAVKKRVTVIMLAGDFSDLAACTFYLPAGLPLSTYQMKMRATKAWAAGASTGAALYVYAATVGSDRWIQLDNARLQFTPSATILGTECIEPVEVLKPPSASASIQGGPSVSAPQPVAAPSGPSPARGVRGFDGSARPGAGDNPHAEWLTLDGAGGGLRLGVAAGRLRFLSSLAAVAGAGGAATIQISLDGVEWRTLLDVPQSDAWIDKNIEVDVDLNEYAGRTIYLQFLHTSADGESEWRIVAVHLTGAGLD